MSDAVPDAAYYKLRLQQAQIFQAFLTGVVRTRMCLPGATVEVLYPSACRCELGLCLEAFLEPVAVCVTAVLPRAHLTRSVESHDDKNFNSADFLARSSAPFSELLLATLKAILHSESPAATCSAVWRGTISTDLEPLWPAHAIITQTPAQPLQHANDDIGTAPSTSNACVNIPTSRQVPSEILVTPISGHHGHLIDHKRISADCTTEPPRWALFVSYAPTITASLLMEQCDRAVRVVSSLREGTMGWCVLFLTCEDLLWTYGSGIHCGVDFGSSPPRRSRGGPHQVGQLSEATFGASVNDGGDDGGEDVYVSRSSRHRNRIEASICSVHVNGDDVVVVSRNDLMSCCSPFLQVAPPRVVHPVFSFSYRVVVNVTSPSETTVNAGGDGSRSQLLGPLTPTTIPIALRRQMSMKNIVVGWLSSLADASRKPSTTEVSSSCPDLLLDVMSRVFRLFRQLSLRRISHGRGGASIVARSAPTRLVEDVISLMVLSAIEQLNLIHELRLWILPTSHRPEQQLLLALVDEAVTYVVQRVAAYYSANCDNGTLDTLRRDHVLFQQRPQTSRRFQWEYESVNLVASPSHGPRSDTTGARHDHHSANNSKCDCFRVSLVQPASSCDDGTVTLVALDWSSGAVTELFLFFQSISASLRHDVSTCALLPPPSSGSRCGAHSRPQRRWDAWMASMATAAKRGFVLCGFCGRVADGDPHVHDQQPRCHRCVAQHQQTTLDERRCVVVALQMAREAHMHLTTEALSLLLKR